MKLDHLRYFAHLAEVLNYTKAAEDLFIAQPTLSTAIKRMEQELGVTLFNRSEGVASRVELTEAGRIFHEHVAVSLEEYDKGLRLARNVQEKGQNTLRLGTVYSMKGPFWSEAIDSFINKWGTLPHFHMEQAYSSNLARQLKAGTLDVAFAAMTPEAQGLVAVPVWHQMLVAGVNKANPLAKQTSVTLDQLREYRILTYNEPSAVSAAVDSFLEKQGADLELVRTFDDELSLSAFVSSHCDNVALMAYSILANAYDDVVCLPVSDAPEQFHTIYLMCRNEEHSEIVQDFISFMSSYHFETIKPSVCAS